MNTFEKYTVKDIVNLVEKNNTPDFGTKNWLYQPSYFESIFKHIDLKNNKDKLFIELGVFAQHTLSLINLNTEDIKVYGFDTFTGLPESWESKDGVLLYEENSFEIPAPPNTEKNEFIQGNVEDTLLNFLNEKNTKIKFVHLDLDLYNATKYSLECIYDWLDDESILVLDDVHNFPHWEEFAIKALADTLDLDKFNVEPIATCGWEDGWSSLAIKLTRKLNIKKNKSTESKSATSPSLLKSSPNSKVTIITGLWDLGRGQLDGWAKRDFIEYKRRFFELLEADAQMAIWIPKELEQEVLDIRGDKPTKIFIKENKDFETWNPFFTEIQNIRTSVKWKSQAGWLENSPQAELKFYNAMMMCKMFMVNDTAIINPFDSEYFYWIDGGLTSTVDKGYFIKDRVLDNLENFTKSTGKFTFIQYPYDSNTEIHGFEREALAEYCAVDFVDRVSRGGFFGGKKEQVHQMNALYYGYLEDTLKAGYMGADECLFTILSYRHKDLIDNFEIEGNGLVWPFFENLKKYSEVKVGENTSRSEVALYVLTYNSPKQFKTLIESFEAYDLDYLNKTKKFLLNNSTDNGTTREYEELCEKYNFEHIKKDNIGICGGRQFIAEHFDEEVDADYYMFFEDDMFFYNGEDIQCKNGFIRKIKNLFSKSLEIIQKEKYDFLKLNFTEFFGDNQKQWSWHNVSADKRAELFPENPVKNSPDVLAAPFMKFNNIKSHKGLPYASGEVYYCNWPQLISREGSRKVFLDVKWQYPYEQTWMSYAYQETLKGNIKPGLLLATPTQHDRFEFYPGEQRREN